MKTQYVLSFLAFVSIFLLAGCGKQKIDDGGLVAPVPVVEEVVVPAKDASVEVVNATYAIDLDNSSLEWVGKAVGKSHNGTVNIISGEVELKDSQVVSGLFEIDMTTIKTLDLQGTAAQGLDSHLKNEDFFAVDEYPLSTLSVRNMALNGGAGQITADLTIKGITNEIVFPFTYVMEGDNLEVQADLLLDRTLWDVRYGSGKFFQDLGDKVISDDMEISLNILLKK